MSVNPYLKKIIFKTSMCDLDFKSDQTSIQVYNYV